MKGAKKKSKANDAKRKAEPSSRRKKKGDDITSDEEDEGEGEEEEIESDDDVDDRSKYGKSAPTSQKGRGKTAATGKESKTFPKESSSVRKAQTAKSKVTKSSVQVSNNHFQSSTQLYIIRNQTLYFCPISKQTLVFPSLFIFSFFSEAE